VNRSPPLDRLWRSTSTRPPLATFNYVRDNLLKRFQICGVFCDSVQNFNAHVNS
jgi:hypothetical protein